MSSRSAPLNVTVSTLTRKRPKMLEALLKSWGDMTIPSDCKVGFLVVENDDVPSSKEAVESFGPNLKNGAPIQYVLETEQGIPFGRNRAAREAMENGADLLCFVDDDEVVAPDWLERMIAGYRASTAVLLGAPLRAAAPAGTETTLQRLMLKNIDYRYMRKEQAAARRASLDDTGGVTIVTNNWLGETQLFSEKGIWFDETMRLTGGTDAKFYGEVVAAGLPVGWVSDAFVYETVPAERLSFWYQVGRGRDQSNTHLRRKLDQKPGKAILTFLTVPVLLVALIAQLVLLPFQPNKRLIELARTLGRLIGILGVLVGYKSKLYKQVSGV